MRIWDIHPGYLNRQSLLGEHRELHGIVSIILNGKKGYSRHPEAIRWKDFILALKIRHKLLVAEMNLRNFNHLSPVEITSVKKDWPKTYIDSPARQFLLLKTKYKNREMGRIPLPKSVQELWSHHKYSVLARDQNFYRKIGKIVAKNEIGFEELALKLVQLLRKIPDQGNLKNAIFHMWGHISKYSSIDGDAAEKTSLKELLKEIQRCAFRFNDVYLLHSTALTDLEIWIS